MTLEFTLRMVHPWSFRITGERMDLAADPPQFVKLATRRSVRRWRDRRLACSLPGLMVHKTGIATKGIKAAAKAPGKKDPLANQWTAGCRAALRSAVSNGQWPQVRLKRAGLADSDLCQLCHEAPGTILHRRHCRATRHTRGDMCVPKHLKATYNALSESQKRHLQTRGLVELPDISMHGRSEHDTLQWTMYPEDGVLQTGWKVYLDGSLRDGPNEHLTRAGFGFIAYGEDGRVRAAACGVPPPWINSIHGAELWALYAAMRISLPGVSYRSDRKAVVDMFKNGATAATAATVEMARLWRLVFAACDGTPNPHDTVDLVWMAAHTKEKDAGVLRLSDGSLLTKRDRQANDAADFLAKRGAQTHRVLKAVRTAFKERELLAEWAAQSLGIATFAANNLKVEGQQGLQRDSTGLPKHKRKSKPTPTASDPGAACDPPLDEPPTETAGHGRPPKRTYSAARDRANSASSSCDSSEADLEADLAASSARACMARQRRASCERTQRVLAEAGRRACTDEGEATARHRLLNVRKRVRWKECQATTLAHATPADASCVPVLAEPPAGTTTPLPCTAGPTSYERRRPLRLATGEPSFTPKATSDAIRSLLG